MLVQLRLRYQTRPTRLCGLRLFYCWVGSMLEPKRLDMIQIKSGVL